RPLLVGRPEVIAARIERYGLRLKAGADFDLININSDSRYRECCQLYFQLMGRKGGAPDEAREAVLRKPSVIRAPLLRMGHCDALVLGPMGKYEAHLRHVAEVIGAAPGVEVFGAMNALVLPARTLFVCDTYVNRDPSAKQLAEIATLAAE